MSRLLLFWLALLGAAALFVFSLPEEGAGAQPMPPHPSLLKRIQEGEVRAPPHTDDPTQPSRMGIDAASSSVPLSGDINLLAVPVDFSDAPHTVDPDFFDELIFANHPVNGKRSVYDYFFNISYETIRLETENLPGSLGWQRAPQPASYYINGDYCLSTTYPQNCQKLAEEIIDGLDSVVDFSDYDNDNDGYTEPIILVHAGSGAEISGSVNDIWSHFDYLDNPRSYDGKIINSYIIVPEYWYTASTDETDMTIGVFAHEMGHGFWDLVDLYDRDDSSYGIGDWGLMGLGAWNGTLGDVPAWPMAWSRLQMGINTTTAITETAIAEKILRVDNSPSSILELRSAELGSQEYFLLEYRQKVVGSYDEYLPGEGLLIWHIDEAMNVPTRQNDKECTVWPKWQCDDSQHYLVALEQADGQRDLEYRTNVGDGGDPFPGSANNRYWSTATNPESSSWYGADGEETCLAVTNITKAGANIVADIHVNCGIGDLEVTATTETEISLAWDDISSDEDGYKIERSLDGSAWEMVGQVDKNVLTYTDTTLNCGTTYYYRIYAYSADGNSPYSNIVDGTTQTCATCADSYEPDNTHTAANPIPVGGVAQTHNFHETLDNDWVQFTVQAGRVYTIATANLGLYNDTYIYLYGPDGTTVLAENGDNGQQAASQIVWEATANGTYYVRAHHQNMFSPGGCSGYNYDLSILESAGPEPPAVPTNLAAAALSQTEVRLAWDDNSSDEDGFKIERSPDGANWSQIATVARNTTAYTDTGLSCNTAYAYRLRAYHANGDSDYSNTASTATRDTTLPGGSLTINNAATYANNQTVDIALTGTDNGVCASGVDQMRLHYNGAWSAWESYTVSKSLSLSNQGINYIYVQYQDAAGNVSEEFGTYGMIILDTISPSGAIQLASDIINTQQLTLTLFAQDAGSGLGDMRFSADGLAWSGWQAYATAANWTLNSANGLQTVYVQYRDRAENVSPLYTATITLDTIAPASTMPDLPASQTEPDILVTWGNLALQNADIACYDVQAREDMKEWVDWQQCTQATSAIYHGQPGHTYYFRSRAKDTAGNWESYPVNPDYDTFIAIQSVSDEHSLYVPMILK